MNNDEINNAAVNLSRALRLVGLDPKEMSFSSKTISYLCKTTNASAWEQAVPQILKAEKGWTSHLGERYILNDKGPQPGVIKAVFVGIKSDAIVSAAELLGGLLVQISKSKAKAPVVGARTSYAVSTGPDDIEYGVEVDLPNTKPRKIRPSQFNSSRAGVSGIYTESNSE